MNLKHFLTLCVFTLFAISCRKNKDVITTPLTTTTPPVIVSPDVIKDSVLLYTKDIYLWYNQIPASFAPRTYADPAAIMQGIRAYSNEAGFSQPVDRWSFAMKKDEWDKMSAGMSADFSGANATGDLGIRVMFRVEGDLRVKYVERESPAGLAGVRRGWRITKINGSTNITTSNSAFIIDNIYEATSSTITFVRPDGTAVDLSLNASSYKEHPVTYDNVYTINSKKIGYLVFNSFLGDTIEINNEFQRVFTKFASENVKDVVIDLRYNGGGYVSVQERLANYLISSSFNGSLMMKQQFNDKYPQYNSTSYFRKSGSLNVQNIYFIVSSSTASASELLINNLKPYMNVHLLGNSATHGKPVGFFPIPVGEWYIFPVSFKTTNKNGEGSYFSGMQLNSQVADGLDKDWGDETEASLQRAIKHITTGTFAPVTLEPFVEVPVNVKYGNAELDKTGFKGMVK